MASSSANGQQKTAAPFPDHPTVQRKADLTHLHSCSSLKIPHVPSTHALGFHDRDREGLAGLGVRHYTRNGQQIPDLLVSQAARFLLKNKYGCLPVVDGSGDLVGIITEADFLRLTVRLLP